MPVPPKEVCPFSAQQSFGCPTSLPGLQQQARPEVSEHCSHSLAPSGNRSPTILSLREFLTGLTTRLFNPAPKLTGTPTGMVINLVWVQVVGRYEDSSRTDECIMDTGSLVEGKMVRFSPKQFSSLTMVDPPQRN
jgi:hypothetical protein